MNFNITLDKIEDIKADLEIIVVVGGDLGHGFVKDRDVLEKVGFEGKHEQLCLLAEKGRLYVGCENLCSNDFRAVTAVAVRSLDGMKFSSAKIATYASNPQCTEVLRGMVEGLVLGSYKFQHYKSKKEQPALQEITISFQEYHGYEIDSQKCGGIISSALILADATNYTRDIVNMAPDDCYPEIMGHMAMELAAQNNLDCTILNVDDLKKEKMGALLAVARASRHEPRLIHLVHKPKDPVAVVSLVGKGLTYDSGGLSLKPADYMVTMKADKSGGSAILGIMKAVSQLNIPVEVHGFVGAVENMIGGDAYKPDDVLISKNGKTIEVRNTDAEGRLVLADVLAYAQQEVQADYIFDLATLTGACVVGVGEYTSGVMGNSELLINNVLYAANKSAGEYATKLSFNRYLGKTLKSQVADISNISNTRYGGAITAAMFLNEFINEENKEKWVHLDIAGPAFVEHAWGENPSGASGAGVRMMTRLIEELANKN